MVAKEGLMKALKTTLFVLAVFTLATQALRHVYVRYLEPRTSVLDAFEETETTKSIKEAISLNELVSQYDAAKKRVDALDEERKKAERNLTKDERDVVRDRFREEHEEEYERASDLKGAIRDWEEKSEKIRELRIFWIFGAGLFAIGAVLYGKRSAWLGLSLLITGAVEMIWWTSPTFTFIGNDIEFDRLLINKLALTLATLVLIIMAWLIDERKK
jgi:hypothetical protein